MAWDLTIAGTSRKASVFQAAGVSVARRYNERSTATFTCLPGYVPDMHEAVVIYAQDGTTKIFSGVVVARRTSGNNLSLYWTEVECASVDIYADWVMTEAIFGTVAAQTLAWFVGQMAARIGNGVTMHASQATGPFVQPVAWPYKKVSDCLRELTDQTGWTWSIDADLKLRMVEAGAGAAAPFSITEADTHCLTLDWEESDEAYGTKVVMEFGGSGTATKTWSFTGADATHDSTIDYYTLPYNASSDNGLVWPSSITVTGHPTQSGAVTWGVVAGALWCWDYLYHRLRYDTAIGGAIGAGDQIETFSFTAQFPSFAVQDSGDTPVVEYRVTSSTQDYSAAQAVAINRLAEVHRRAKKVQLTTLEHGVMPGMSMSIDLHDSRDLDAITMLVDTVDVQLVTDSYWVYTVRGTEGAIASVSELQIWRAMLGTAAVASATESAPVATELASPVTLGGSGDVSITQVGTPVYEAVVGSSPYTPGSTITATVRVWMRARTAGGGVTARLWDTTDSVSVGESDTVTGTTMTVKTIAVSLTSGHAYVLQLLSATVGGSVYGYGQVERA